MLVVSLLITSVVALLGLNLPDELIGGLLSGLGLSLGNGKPLDVFGLITIAVPVLGLGGSNGGVDTYEQQETTDKAGCVTTGLLSGKSQVSVQALDTHTLASTVVGALSLEPLSVNLGSVLKQNVAGATFAIDPSISTEWKACATLAEGATGPVYLGIVA